MKRMLLMLIVGFAVVVPMSVHAQDGDRVAKEIFLDDEELDVEADLPSVDLVLSFKGLRYENIDPKKSFFDELIKTVDDKPF